MKIGIDCRLWSETGVGRYIRNLVLNLQKIDKKNEYILFALKKDKEKILKQVQNDKFKIIEADIKWHTLKEQLKFPKILNKEDLDLVHFPYHSVPVFYSKPFILTIHDLIPYNFPTGKASTLPFPLYYLKLLGYKFVINQAARKTRRIIAISNATKNEIISHLKVSEDKVTVIYEGAENSKFPTSSRSAGLRGASKTQKYFLYVGNAFPHKNLDRLLEAFFSFCHPERSEGSREILRSAQNDILLILVGKEDYFYKRLRKQIEELKLSDKIVFLQNINDEELSDLYQNAIAFVTPSLMEGFGLPALEAMVNKCLVLASDIPALREVCGDAAVYFDPYNKRDIEEKMLNVCFNDLNHFSKRTQMGFERVKLFSWRKMAKETLKIYKQAIDNS